MTKHVTITTDAGAMPAHLWLPPTGHGPGIVLFQEIFGVSDYIQRRGAQLAELGYVVVAPEIFWRLGVVSPVEGDDALQQGVALVSYYGSALPDLHETLTVTAPSLHHFGLADSFIDTETVRRIEASVTQQPDTVFETYAGADHAFDNDDMPWHDPSSSTLAWSSTVGFLRERLPVS